jgi:hypothetical protein
MLTFQNLRHATGLYAHDLIQALKHEGFPLPMLDSSSGRELCWPDEVDE